MRITKEELVRRIVDSVQDNTAVYAFDNERQVMIYTGMYKWSDGFYHDEPEYNYDHDVVRPQED